MANCSQTNNTKIGTSAVIYDSTPLPCTDVKACDDLNTILTKFDNVICSAINSVNILTEEVMNITEDLMIITEEIENINDQIFICCPICDFTVTATELPVCEFTASATELPVCNFTGSVNQVPDLTTTTTSSSSTSTTSTTSTTTSTSSTTTTTTTCPCYTYNIVLGEIDASEGGIQINYYDCNNIFKTRSDTTAGTGQVCSINTNIPVINKLTTPPIKDSTVTITSECCTSPPFVCFQYNINPPLNPGDPTHNVEYVPCEGGLNSLSLSYGDSFQTICVQEITFDSNSFLTQAVGDCTPTTTTTTTI